MTDINSSLLRIVSFNVYNYDLNTIEKSYNFSLGKAVSCFDSVVIEIITNYETIKGYGECTPLGPFYLPSQAKGILSGFDELLPKLIGLNPLLLTNMNNIMDFHLKGHPQIKSSIDIACWDILGKYCKVPLYLLLGGKFDDDIILYRAISKDTPSNMANNVLKYKSEGQTRFQLKVGDPNNHNIDKERIKQVRDVLDDTDILVADANTGWVQQEAIDIVNYCKNINVYIEQPCDSYENCLHVRNKCSNMFILDECVQCVDDIIRLYNDNACDIINLKISKFGGLTKAKQGRDLCVSLGIAMTIEDTWGSDIVTATIAHLAHSTPTKFRFSSTDFNSYNHERNAFNAPKNINGKMRAPEGQGLGIEINFKVIGEPVKVQN